MAIICSGHLAAQENTQTNKTLTNYYDTELFQWDYNLLGGMALNFDNQSSVTWYGIKDSMKNALLQYEDTSRQYRLFRGKILAGNILMWGGFATVITPVFFNWNTMNDTQRSVVLGVMAGGLLTEFVGMFIISSGQANIINAVNVYNRHKISEYK